MKKLYIALAFILLIHSLAANAVTVYPRTDYDFLSANSIYNVTFRGNIVQSGAPAMCNGTNYFMVFTNLSTTVCAQINASALNASSSSSLSPPIYVNGTKTGLNTNTPGATLDVNGSASIGGNISAFGTLFDFTTARVRTGTLDILGQVNQSGGIMYTPQLCLNGDCKTAWPTGGGGGANVTSTANSTPYGYIAYFTTGNSTISNSGLISNETNVTKYSIGANSAIWSGGTGLSYNGNTAYIVSKDTSMKFCISTTHGTIGCGSERGKIDTNGFWYFGSSGASATARVTVDGNLSVTGSAYVIGNLSLTNVNNTMGVANLSGTGNAYVCVNSNGILYRNVTSCN